MACTTCTSSLSPGTTSSTATAMECGTSSRIIVMAFSRTSSAISWSAVWSGGKYGGPSGRRRRICSIRVSIPSPLAADTGMISAQDPSSARRCSCGSCRALAKRSILLSTAMTGVRTSARMAARYWSPRPIPSLPSTMNTMQSTLPRLARAVSLRREPSRVLGLWMPGVSTNTTCAASAASPEAGTCRIPRIAWRVVCGTGVVIAILCPTTALSRVDLPTFGRPMIEQKPERIRRGSAARRSHPAGARGPTRSAWPAPSLPPTPRPAPERTRTGPGGTGRRAWWARRRRRPPRARGSHARLPPPPRAGPPVRRRSWREGRRSRHWRRCRRHRRRSATRRRPGNRSTARRPPAVRPVPAPAARPRQTAPPDPSVPPAARGSPPHAGVVRFALQLLHEHLGDASTLHPLGGEPHAVDVGALPGEGDVAQHPVEQPAHGVPLLGGQVAVEQVVELVDRQARVHPPPPLAELLHKRFLAVVLVHDLADDLLQDVLDRDQPSGGAVLVDDHGQVHLLRLQLAQQRVDPLELRDERCGAQKVFPGPFSPAPECRR